MGTSQIPGSGDFSEPSSPVLEDLIPEACKPLFHLTQEAVYLHDIQGHFLEANAAALRLLGYHREEIPSITLDRLAADAASLAKTKAGLQRLLSVGPDGQAHTYQLKTKQGKRIWVEVIATLFYRDGGPYAVQGIARDITERKKAEMELAAAHQKLNFHVENSPLGVIEWDAEGRVTRWSGQAEKIFGWQLEEVLGRRPAEWRFIHQEDETTVFKIIDRLIHGMDERSVNLNRNYHKDGHVVWCHWYNSVLRLKDGTVLSILSLAHDVTPQIQQQETLSDLSRRLLQAEESERRRIAQELHDTTAQDLIAVMMNLDFLRDPISLCGEKPTKQLEDALALLENSIHEIRTLSYVLHPPSLKEAGLLDAIRHYASGFEERTGIAISLELPEEFPRLPDTTELTLFRVVQECLSNIHRHSKSSTASIGVRQTVRSLELKVSDAGCGIDPASRDGLRGVGIAGMRERLRQIGGSLEIQSTAQGAIVLATLPIQGSNHE